MRHLRMSSAIEVRAPVALVWQVLSRPWAWLPTTDGPWSVADARDRHTGTDAVMAHELRLPGVAAARIQTTTALARCPDRLSWVVSGDLDGEMDWELDDLDDVTFVRGTWVVRPVARRLRSLGPLAAPMLGRAHAGAVAQVCSGLSAALAAQVVRARAAAARHDRPARSQWTAVPVS